MLHSTIVASEAAEETSTKAVRHRGTQVIPRGSYSFGDAELLPGSCMTIQPMPVSRVIPVHQSAVAPDSLPGGALPRETAVMPTGEMRGLGEPLAPVPAAFRHGVASSKRAILGDKDVRRVGSSLVSMATPAADYERNPISQDVPYLNRSGGAAVLPSYGMAPDDRLRQKLIQPTEPGPSVSRSTQIAYERPGYTADTRARYEAAPIAQEEPGTVYVPPSRRAPRFARRRSVRGLSEDRPPNTIGIGVAALGIAAGLYWFVIRS